VLREMLVRFGRKRRWDADLIDEVAQRTLLEWLSRRLPATVPPPHKFWLRALGHARRVLGEREATLGDQDGNVAAPELRVPLIQKWDLERHLNMLPVRERQALVWLYQEGWSRGEVARALSLRPEACRTLLHRARQHLAATFDAESHRAKEDFL
jgi:RNA polymerase sigma factor (sigma-70 family)